MTLRNRIGAVSALVVAGVLMVAAPVSAATTHPSYKVQAVVAAPVPSPSGAPSDGATEATAGSIPGVGGTTDVPTAAPSVPSTDAPAADQGGPGKSPASDDGSAKWFGIGAGLLAGIGLGLGFVFWRKQKGSAAVGGK
jgi:hypothetical protein